MASDSLGRDIGGIDAGMIASLMQGKVGKPTIGPGKKNDGTIEGILSGFVKDFQASMAKAKKVAESAAKAKKPESLKATSKAEAKMEKDLTKFVMKATKKGSIYTHDISVEDAVKQLADAIKKERGGSGIPRPPRPPRGDDDDTKIRPKGGHGAAVRNEDIWVMREYLAMVYETKEAVDAVSKALLGGVEVVGTLLQGVIKDETLFVRNLRAAVWETQGITGETHSLQQAWQDIGKSVAATGQDRTVFQNAYIKNLKRGVTDQKLSLAMTRAQLNAETLIGVEADSLGETYATWVQSFRMNDAQIASMSRGLRDVARFSGVTGENLTKVVQASEKSISRLKSAGTLTARAAQNTIHLAAELQKAGVSDQFEDINNALESSTHLLNKANSGTQFWLLNAGKAAGVYEDVLNGTVKNSTQKMKALNQGMLDVIKRFKGLEGITFDNFEEVIDKMSGGDKRILNFQLEGAGLPQIGDIANGLKAMKEASMGLDDRLGDITKKLKTNVTEEEKIALLEEQRRLKESAALQALTGLSEAAKNAQSMDDALTKFGNKREDFEKDLNAIGISWTTNADVARQAIQSALGSVNAGLKKGGKQELNVSSKEIEEALKDPKAFRELSSKIDKAQQESAIASKKQVDPMTAMEQTLKETNELLRSMSSGIINSVMNFVGSFLVWGAVVTTLLGQLLVSSLGFGIKIHSLASGWNKLLGKKPGGTAATLEPEAATPAPGAGGAAAGAAGDPCGAMNGMLKKMPSMKAIGMTLIKGAAALAILVAGLLLVATAIVLLSKGITKITGISPEEAIKTAKGVAGIIGAVGLITVATLAASVGLYGLGAFIAWAPAAVPLMALGALALLLLGPALALLSYGVTSLTDGIMKDFGIDPAEAAKTAEAVGSLMKSAGMIAVGALATGYALTLLPSLLGMIPIMLAGAAILLLLGPALVLLASAVVAVAGWAMSGIDPKKAAETADDVSNVISAAGRIAWGITEAVGGLALLGVLAGFGSLALAGIMILGAKALMLLTPSMIILARAVIGIADVTMSLIGINAKQAKEVSENMAGVIGAAGDIASSVLGMIPKLAALAALSLIAPFVAVAMMTGAKTFAILALPVLLFTAAITAMAMAFTTVFDPGKAATAAEGLKNVLQSGADIASSILERVPQLSALAALAFIAPFVAGIMMIGAKTFAILAAPVLLFTAAIAAMAMAFNKIIDPKEAEKAATGLANTLQAGGLIASNILEMVPKLAVLGAFSFIASFVAGLMWSGVIAFLILSMPILAFVASIVGLATAMGTAQELSKASNTIDEASSMLKLVPPMITSLSEALNMMGTGGWFETTPADTINRYKDKFEKWFDGVAVLLKDGIIKTVNTQFKKEDAADLHRAGRTIKTLANIAESLPRLIGGLAEVMKMMDSGGWYKKTPADAIRKNKDGFKVWFTSIAELLSEGVIKVVNEKFEDAAKVEAAGKIIEQVTKVATLLPKLIEGLGNAMSLSKENGFLRSINPLMDDTPASAIVKNKDKFKEWFKTVALFLKEGVILPVTTTFAGIEDKVAQAATLIESLTKITMNLIPLINNLAAVVVMAKPDGDAAEIIENKDLFKDYFEKINIFIKEGLVDPLTNDKSAKIEDLKTAFTKITSIKSLIAETAMALNSLNTDLMGLLVKVDKGPSVMQNITKNTDMFKEYFENITKFITKGIYEPISQLPDNDKLQPAVNKMNAISNISILLSKSLTGTKDALKSLNESGDLNDLDDIAGSMDSLTKVFTGLNQMQMFFGNAGLNPTAAVAVATSLTAFVDAIHQIRTLLQTLAGELNAISTTNIDLSKLAGLFQGLDAVRASMPAGMPAGMPLAPASAAAPMNDLVDRRARPTGLAGDVESKIQQAQTGNEVPTTQVTSPELGNLASSNDEQLETQRKMVALLEQIAQALQPSSAQASGGGNPETHKLNTRVIPRQNISNGQQGNTAKVPPSQLLTSVFSHKGV